MGVHSIASSTAKRIFTILLKPYCHNEANAIRSFLLITSLARCFSTQEIAKSCISPQNLKKVACHKIRLLLNIYHYFYLIKTSSKEDYWGNDGVCFDHKLFMAQVKSLCWHLAKPLHVIFHFMVNKMDDLFFGGIKDKFVAKGMVNDNDKNFENNDDED